jgi:hypothetical protein
MEEEAGAPATVAVYVTVPDKEAGAFLPWALWLLGQGGPSYRGGRGR